jgi:hypothetical protein
MRLMLNCHRDEAEEASFPQHKRAPRRIKTSGRFSVKMIT